MRRAATGPARRGQVSRTYSQSAPIKGWNQRDSIAAMPAGFAPLLTNWFPTVTDVMLRKGSATYSTGITSGGIAAEVETLIAYKPASGAQQLFAWAGEYVYNASSAGAVGAPVVSGLSTAVWQAINTSTPGGYFLAAVNGVDPMLLYNGTTWQEVTAVSAPIAITGVPTTEISNIYNFKNRTWMIQADTLCAWFLPVSSIGGAASQFDLTSIFMRGGYLVGICDWTLDGGEGIDDLIVFITSEGEVAVYQGTDPTSASTFALVGVYKIGAPVDTRSNIVYGGDVLVLTLDGLMPMSKALISARINKAIALSDSIAGAISNVTGLYQANQGWQIKHFPAGSQLIINVPVATGQQVQYVMNTVTNAWTQFTGWPANCFEVFDDNLYYATNGEVRQAWVGTADIAADIVAEMVCAFDYFQNRDGLKQVKMVRPVIGWDANPASFLLGVDANFVIQTPTSTVAFAPSSAGLWDVAKWDVAQWGGSVIYNTNWYGAATCGFALAAHLLVSSSQANVRCAAFDYVYEPGGVL